jgi:hypothetical protein
MSDSPIQSGLTPPNARHTSAGAGTDPADSFPAELRELAAQNAGRWVYEIDPAFDRANPVPPQGIVGAWRIDDSGSPTGEFVANSHYLPSTPKNRRLHRHAMLATVALVVIALVIAGVLLLFVLPDAKGGKDVQATPGPESHTGPVTQAEGDHAKPAAAPHGPGTRQILGTRASPRGDAGLKVVATQRVWVCLQDARGRLLINGQILQPGEISRRFASSAFRIYLGNGGVSLRIDGRVHRVTPDPNPVAYGVSQHGIVALAAGVQPACA